jgi:4-hydroxythreonine-4-phosphate dehydrogenase
MSEFDPKKPVIGISLGDYNGIGPEIILKTLQNNQLNKHCTPVVYGSMRIMNRYRQLLAMKDWQLSGIQKIEQANPKVTNVLNCWNEPQEDIQPGQVTPEAGKGAYEALKRAVEDLKAGKLAALVTAPINKNNIQNDEFKFPGHTEYLADAFEAKEPLMFMVSDILRVGVVTGHVPLLEVPSHITKAKIVTKLQAMLQSLRYDFNIQKPRIAVLGLNPHAGEEGLLGKEEQETILPALKELKNKGHLVFGPFPADGFFAAQTYRQYDAVLAMYHDQGLIPFKSIAFNDGVNFTAGLSVVRTSPDHGTAYDIAGKNKADETSMRQAIFAALDIVQNREQANELSKNALKKNPIVEKMNVSEDK